MKYFVTQRLHFCFQTLQEERENAQYDERSGFPATSITDLQEEQLCELHAQVSQ
jgi:hypothetical protein